MESKHYVNLAIMAVLSFIAMYVLMYAMVNTVANVYPNFNQFLRDSENRKLCSQIIASQPAEINLMKAKLENGKG